MKDEEIKKAVREGYAKIAEVEGSCYTQSGSCCCGSDMATDISKKIGYSEEDLLTVPDGANLGLGCGNPVALASLSEGETVLDLGSGAGFDCFLAAKRVGNAGRVIGVDMTPEMLEKARENARAGGYENVEFRLGEIEHIPAADNSVDAVISNCVINLVPDKRAAFAEAFRVLEPGGRLMVSDIVLSGDLPEEVRASIAAYIGCVAGAVKREEYLDALRSAGFESIEVLGEKSFPVELVAGDPTAKAIMENMDIAPERAGEVAGSVSSISVFARKAKGS